MKRFEVRMTREQRQVLEGIAARTGRSISALVRDAVEIVYGSQGSTARDLEAMDVAFGAWRDREADGGKWVDDLRSGGRVRLEQAE